MFFENNGPDFGFDCQGKVRLACRGLMRLATLIILIIVLTADNAVAALIAEFEVPVTSDELESALTLV